MRRRPSRPGWPRMTAMRIPRPAIKRGWFATQGPASPPVLFLFAQRAHRALQAIYRQREHALVHQLLDDGDRLAVLPDAFRIRIEPCEFRERAGEARQP